MSLLLPTMPQCTAISETKETTYRIVPNSLKIPKGDQKRKSAKDKQYNGQKKIDNRTNNDIQNTSTYKVELRWKKNYWKLKE